MSTLNDRDIRRCMAIVRNELIIKISYPNNLKKSSIICFCNPKH